MDLAPMIKEVTIPRCIHYGIDDYLVKPFHLSELFIINQDRFPNIEINLGSELADDIRKDLKGAGG
ncbi:MAG: hypothetical protein R2727_06445 [Bacteroidales bacterium]